MSNEQELVKAEPEKLKLDALVNVDASDVANARVVIEERKLRMKERELRKTLFDTEREIQDTQKALTKQVKAHGKSKAADKITQITGALGAELLDQLAVTAESSDSVVKDAEGTLQIGITVKLSKKSESSYGYRSTDDIDLNTVYVGATDTIVTLFSEIEEKETELKTVEDNLMEINAAIRDIEFTYREAQAALTVAALSEVEGGSKFLEQYMGSGTVKPLLPAGIMDEEDNG